MHDQWIIILHQVNNTSLFVHIRRPLNTICLQQDYNVLIYMNHAYCLCIREVRQIVEIRTRSAFAYRCRTWAGATTRSRCLRLAAWAGSGSGSGLGLGLFPLAAGAATTWWAIDSDWKLSAKSAKELRVLNWIYCLCPTSLTCRHIWREQPPLCRALNNMRQTCVCARERVLRLLTAVKLPLFGTQMYLCYCELNPRAWLPTALNGKFLQ